MVKCQRKCWKVSQLVGHKTRAKLKCISVKQHQRGVYGLYSKGYARSNTVHTAVTELSLCPWQWNGSTENFNSVSCMLEISPVMQIKPGWLFVSWQHFSKKKSFPNLCICFAVCKIMIQKMHHWKSYLIGFEMWLVPGGWNQSLENRWEWNQHCS